MNRQDDFQSSLNCLAGVVVGLLLLCAVVALIYGLYQR